MLAGLSFVWCLLFVLNSGNIQSTLVNIQSTFGNSLGNIEGMSSEGRLCLSTTLVRVDQNAAGSRTFRRVILFCCTGISKFLLILILLILLILLITIITIIILVYDMTG
jgi:hypothetical protein